MERPPQKICGMQELHCAEEVEHGMSNYVMSDITKPCQPPPHPAIPEEPVIAPALRTAAAGLIGPYLSTLQR